MVREGAGIVALALSVIVPACSGPPTEALVRAVVEQRLAAVGRRDLEAIVALYSPSSVQTSPGFCADRSGPEGARRTYRELFDAYPNITADPTAYVVQGNRVAVQFFARTRKPDGTIAFEVRLANFLTIEHGQITRDETYFDTKGQPCS